MAEKPAFQSACCVAAGTKRKRCIREVSRGFWVFRLLFCEESGEGYDVGVDLLGGGSVGCHDEYFDGYVVRLNVCC